MNLQILNNLYMLGKITGDEYAERTSSILSDDEREETIECLQSRMVEDAFPNYAEPFMPNIYKTLNYMEFNGEEFLKRHLAAVVLALVQSQQKQEPAFKETQDLLGRKAILVAYKNAYGGYEEILVDEDTQSQLLYEKVCRNIGLRFKNYIPH